MSEEAENVPVLKYNTKNAEAQMRKGFLEFPVLLIIGKKPTYVPDILKELKKANLLVVEGTLYPLLSRMKRYGLVEYVWEESKSGPPRKMYSITGGGKDTLKALQASWETLDSSLNTLVKNYEESN